ncbi:MAG TPA: cellulose biosynthesis protein BcsS [Rhodoblastus sp.]|nr:cellulose biosynthesis protein BcsS [Rhodoblastus sp.]
MDAISSFAALCRRDHGFPSRQRRVALCAALLVATMATPALAVDWYTGDKTSEPDYTPSVVLDASGSFTTNQSNFGAAALTAALDSNMAQSGFRARLEGVGGGYSYFANAVPVAPATVGVRRKINAVEEEGGALVGYAWSSRAWTFALYGGALVTNTTLDPNDPYNTTEGVHVGGKIVGEFYGNPTDKTMLGGYASYGTNNNEYYSRLKAGYAIGHNIFIGPEFLALGNKFYSEYRAGAHITGVRLAQLTIGVSGGVTSSSVDKSGAYAIVDARLGF